MAVLGISEISKLLITDIINATDNNSGSLVVEGGAAIKLDMRVGGTLTANYYNNLPVATTTSTTPGVTKLYNQAGSQTDGAVTPYALQEALSNFEGKPDSGETENTPSTSIINVGYLKSWRKSIKTTAEGPASITIENYDPDKMQVLAFINGFTLSDGSNGSMIEYSISSSGVVTTTNSISSNQDFMVIVFWVENISKEVSSRALDPVINWNPDLKQVTIYCDTPEVSIYYSINNNDVNTLYAGPFTISETSTIYAKSSGNNYSDSNIIQKVCDIDLIKISNPIIKVKMI